MKNTDADHIDSLAWFAGFAAMLLMLPVLYLLLHLASRIMDYNTAEMIVGIPAFLGFLIISPVHTRVSWWLTKRHCARRGGHHLEVVENHPDLSVCSRCGHYARKRPNRS